MITTEVQRNALKFVLAANSGEYAPTVDEVREWIDRPDPIPGKKGRLLRAAEPPTPSPIVAKFFESMPATQIQVPPLEVLTQNRKLLVDIASQLSGVAHVFGGTPGRPAEYAPDGPPEHTIEQLIRLRWLQLIETGGLKVTPLGRALYESDILDRLGYGDDKGVMVLGAGEEFAWGKLVGHISKLGDCLVIDPYLRSEQLATLKTHTETTRALVGPKLKQDEYVELKVLLAADGYDHIELRKAPFGMLHDRYVISADTVYMMGASMHAIGAKTTTTLMPMEGEASLRIRQLAEEWWDGSDDLRTSP